MTDTWPKPDWDCEGVFSQTLISRLQADFLKFMASKPTNIWLRSRYYQLYLRKSRRFLEGELRLCLDIGNIEVAHQNQGWGTLIIEWLHNNHPYWGTYIESILNDGWCNSLLEHGWKNAGANPPSVYKKREELRPVVTRIDQERRQERMDFG